jgi:hypothetical protein
MTVGDITYVNTINTYVELKNMEWKKMWDRYNIAIKGPVIRADFV